MLNMCETEETGSTGSAWVRAERDRERIRMQQYKGLVRVPVNLSRQLDCIWNQLGMPVRNARDRII